MCCNGVLFKDVELTDGDDPDRLRSLGLPIKAARPGRRAGSPPTSSSSQTKFAQPCLALGSDCRCSVYKDRPFRCREFECALFMSAKSGATGLDAARRVIEKARLRADRVRRLLEALGDKRPDLPLLARFRRVSRRLEREQIDEPTSERYSRLTLAMQELNLVLSKSFH
jgi:uncharacterized protein